MQLPAALQTQILHMKNKGLWTLAGFLMIVLGMTAIILQMVGVNWYFLSFLEIPGRLFAFVAKLLLIFAGAIVVVLARTDWEKERQDSE